jgi:hypothetical protein
MNLGEKFVTPGGQPLQCVRIGNYRARRKTGKDPNEICMECCVIAQRIGLPEQVGGCENKTHKWCWERPTYDFIDLDTGELIKNVTSLVGWNRLNCLWSTYYDWIGPRVFQ